MNRLSLVASELLDLPYADKIMVFGSYASDKEEPADIDVFLDLRGHGQIDPGTYNGLLRIAVRHYGWLDPFLRTDAGLLVRSDEARHWVRASNAAAIGKNMDLQARPLNECLRQQPEPQRPGM